MDVAFKRAREGLSLSLQERMENTQRHINTHTPDTSPAPTHTFFLSLSAPSPEPG